MILLLITYNISYYVNVVFSMHVKTTLFVSLLLAIMFIRLTKKERESNLQSSGNFIRRDIEHD